MNKETKFLLISIVVIIITFFELTFQTKAYDSTFEIGGTIRNVDKGWNLISDSAHSPIGITSVETTNTRIKINHKDNAQKVVTFIVTPDESMTSEGYKVGISGGLDYSYIYIYDSNNNLINPYSYKNKFGNIWISGTLKR